MHKKKKKHFNRARMKVLTLPFGYHDGAKKLERSNLWTREPKKKKKEIPGESCSAGSNPNLHLNRFLFFFCSLQPIKFVAKGTTRRKMEERKCCLLSLSPTFLNRIKEVKEERAWFIRFRKNRKWMPHSYCALSLTKNLAFPHAQRNVLSNRDSRKIEIISPVSNGEK